MSFGTGLSGLNASAKNLDVIGHNISNANTTGMKAGRAEFAEMYASSLGAAGGSNGGIGVAVATVSQLFTQGNIKVTGNNTDMGINGEGFFKVTSTDGSTAYTRNGEFKLNSAGYITTNAGAQLHGYVADPLTGVINTGSTQLIQLPTGSPIAAKQTTAITAALNLDARANNAAGAAAVVGPPAVAAVPITPRETYGTVVNVYDAQGVAVPVNLYFEKGVANTWSVYTSLDAAAPSVGTVTFDASGNILSASPQTADTTVTTPALDLTIDTASANPNNPSNTTGATAGSIVAVLDLKGVTQFGNNFSVVDLSQDGYAAGELTSIATNEAGVISARYSNGVTKDVAQVALTRFRNVQGLQPVNGGYWQATANSGAPIEGQPQSGRFGQIRSGAIEESNVDMTAELVNMIVAQRSYQANAQTIKTQDQVLSTLVNLR